MSEFLQFLVEYVGAAATALKLAVGPIAVGLLTSFSIVYWYDRVTAPKLEILEDPHDPVPAAVAGQYYHHVRVRQVRNRDWLPSRRTAWAVMAEVTAYKSDRKTRVIPGAEQRDASLKGRWTGSPRPLSLASDGRLEPDPSKLWIGRRRDIHYHHSGEGLDVALEVAGGEWFMWNDENYLNGRLYEKHRLPAGEYEVHIQVNYEAGKAEHWKHLVVAPVPSRGGNEMARLSEGVL
jgi:hypothetical protein